MNYSPRPYTLMSPVDDSPEIEACILRLAFDYLRSKDLDIIKVFESCEEKIDKKFIEKVDKMSEDTGVIIPVVWYVYLVEKLCYDLMDIQRDKLSYFINYIISNDEDTNNIRKYTIEKELKKDGIRKRKAFYDTLKTTRDLARGRNVAVKGKRGNNFRYPEDCFLCWNKAPSRSNE